MLAIFQIFIIFLTTNFLFSNQEEQEAIRRIQAHLIIKDVNSACQEAKRAIALYPHSAIAHENFIKTLAKLGYETEMLKAWDHYAVLFPDKKNNRELIEAMCWGILNKASTSSALMPRLMSLLAAFFSQDAKGVDIILLGMRDSNSILREAAVKLAAHLHDTKLLDEMKYLFREEKVWSVRQEVIQAIGEMKIHELRPELESLVCSNQSLAEEKVLAIKALVELLDELNRNEILRLASSNRAGLRNLACEAIAYFRTMRDVDQLFQLAEDHHSEVRASAIQAIGLLRPQTEIEAVLTLARKKISDPNYLVAISSAWLLTLYSPSEGQKAFKVFFNSNRKDVRLLAASALNATGKYGLELSKEMFNNHSDPYVKLNLALGLIDQQCSLPEAANLINHVMASEKDKWILAEQGHFKAVVPRSIKKSQISSENPEEENQLMRLEILNILAIVQPTIAQEAIRTFLAERTWGISGVAAALLLMEGDDLAIDLVKNLQHDVNPKIRLQAALILSLWGQEETSINILEKQYWVVDKESKVKILEGIGRIGLMNSVPFLMDVLKEPSQTLRVVAAMALIQCLNH